MRPAEAGLVGHDALAGAVRGAGQPVMVMRARIRWWRGREVVVESNGWTGCSRHELTVMQWVSAVQPWQYGRPHARGGTGLARRPRMGRRHGRHRAPRPWRSQARPRRRDVDAPTGVVVVVEGAVLGPGRGQHVRRDQRAVGIGRVETVPEYARRAQTPPALRGRWRRRGGARQGHHRRWSGDLRGRIGGRSSGGLPPVGVPRGVRRHQPERWAALLHCPVRQPRRCPTAPGPRPSTRMTQRIG